MTLSTPRSGRRALARAAQSRPVRCSVSVIIPVYNGGQDARKAVKCAIAQEDVTTEILLVNDGSTDDTAAHLDALAAEFPGQVRVIHQENGGPASARNTGIREACGEWIAFLDHDDLWDPRKLRIQLQVAATSGAAMVFTAARNIGDIDGVDEVRGVPAESVTLQSLLMDNVVTLSSVVIRRNVLRGLGGFDESRIGVEDWELWLRIASAGHSIAAVESPLVDYHWHAGGLSKRNEHMQRQRRALIRDTVQSDAGRRLPLVVRQRALAEERACSGWFMAHESFSHAARIYLQGLFAFPSHIDCWKGLIKCLLRRR